MVGDEEIHLLAAAFATNRKDAYIEGVKSGEVDPMSEDALNGKWLAHYEGYREGFHVARDLNATLVEEMGIEGYGTLAIAAAIRNKVVI